MALFSDFDKTWVFCILCSLSSFPSLMSIGFRVES
jgi:hypothetical protein